jgi:membrane associated rhomboid family serine protease
MSVRQPDARRLTDLTPGSRGREQSAIFFVTRLLPKQIVQILGFLAVLVVVHAVNVLSGMWFTQFGVIPRTVVGLRGIVFSPLLHGNSGHLIANAAPLG